MTAHAANRALASGLSTSVPHPLSFNPGLPNINPATGLSTDYLNHFCEAIMMLEMVTMTPECLDDLRAWRPRTYCEHFARSRFSNRDAVIAAYQAADPAVREALDTTAETLNTVLAHSRDMVIRHFATAAGEEPAQRAAIWLKPLISCLAAVINGTAATAEQRSAQAEIDAMFGR
jgi:hypothetical protein